MIAHPNMITNPQIYEDLKRRMKDRLIPMTTDYSAFNHNQPPLPFTLMPTYVDPMLINIIKRDTPLTHANWDPVSHLENEPLSEKERRDIITKTVCPAVLGWNLDQRKPKNYSII